MDLPKPSELKPGEATKSLMKDLEDIAYQVNEIRPLTGPVLKTVQQQLLGERVFSSNAIEGNTLTLRETVLILQTGAILLTVTDFGGDAVFAGFHEAPRFRCRSRNSLWPSKLSAPIFRQPTSVQQSLLP